jgi:hypothetical protein
VGFHFIVKQKISFIPFTFRKNEGLGKGSY